ncbi:Ig-like domain-containing protein [Methanolobus vulcani]|nr:Ig-like domain-containing protein [Methanolobus vulcani]
MTNSEFYNINVSHVGSYLDPKTGYLGISLSEGNNNYGHDLFINDTGWSGFGAAAMENNSRFKNIIIRNSGHNGVDIHPAKNLILESVKVYDSVSNNVIVTAGYQTSPAAENIHFKDFYLENGGAQFSDNVTNITFEDVSIMNGSFKSFGTKDVTVINMSMDHGVDYKNFDEYFLYTKIGSYNVQNGIVIDSSFYRFGSYYTDNALAINTKYQLLSYKNNLAEYYYPSFEVIDSKGINLSGGNLEISNEIDSSIKSVDGYGNEISVFPLDADGFTFSPMVRRLNAPAIAVGKYATDNTYTAYAYSAEFTSPTDDTVTLKGITPDSTWYREDPNTPTYTITAIIPDASSTSPQITGFAPSSDNPFTAGESRKFQVWADQELTTMKWYVNGNLVSSGSMDYTWEVESGTTTIMFSGFNSNGAVVQTWEITEGETVQEDAPVSSGTGLSFTPSATSLTATTGESTTFSVDTSQEFTSAVWSLDGVEVEAGTTQHVESWTTAGTHIITFDGTAAAGTISRSWTVIVSAAAESAYSSISITPSSATVAPGESFSLDVYIDPTQDLTGSQFDLQYSQLASISTVNEGDLFTASGLATTFQYDSIDNAAGLLDNVYAAIVGSGTITSPDVMATIEMVAGSSSGILNIGLSDVILSDVNSNPAGYTVSNATVLIDTAPQFISVPSQTVVEGQSLSFTVSATDADADELTYTATTLPSGATFNGGSFSWTPSEGDAGSYVASFEVTDGYLTDTVNVSITVTPLNHMPEITLFEPADSSVFEEGSTIEVNVAANDADGDSLSYLIEIDGVQVSTSFSYSWTTDYESAGTHTIKVTISDGTEEVSSSSTITITDLQPRWDVNEDGIVNVLDITLVGQNYGKTYTTELPRWDVNQDSTVNIQDLSIVSGHFGETV